MRQDKRSWRGAAAAVPLHFFEKRACRAGTSFSKPGFPGVPGLPADEQAVDGQRRGAHRRAGRLVFEDLHILGVLFVHEGQLGFDAGLQFAAQDVALEDAAVQVQLFRAHDDGQVGRCDRQEPHGVPQFPDHQRVAQLAGVQHRLQGDVLRPFGQAAQRRMGCGVIDDAGFFEDPRLAGVGLQAADLAAFATLAVGVRDRVPDLAGDIAAAGEHAVLEVGADDARAHVQEHEIFRAGLGREQVLPIGHGADVVFRRDGAAQLLGEGVQVEGLPLAGMADHAAGLRVQVAGQRDAYPRHPVRQFGAARQKAAHAVINGVVHLADLVLRGFAGHFLQHMAFQVGQAEEEMPRGDLDPHRKAGVRPDADQKPAAAQRAVLRRVRLAQFPHHVLFDQAGGDAGDHGAGQVEVLHDLRPGDRLVPENIPQNAGMVGKLPYLSPGFCCHVAISFLSGHIQRKPGVFGGHFQHAVHVQVRLERTLVAADVGHHCVPALLRPFRFARRQCGKGFCH